MLLIFLILALLGLVNEFVLDGALTDWVSKNAEVNWHWGIWIMVWLLYVIGDKILKRISSNGENVLNKLNEINGIDNFISDRNPTQDIKNYGGKALDLGLSVNIFGQEGIFKSHKFAVVYIIPVKQRNNGL